MEAIHEDRTALKVLGALRPDEVRAAQVGWLLGNPFRYPVRATEVFSSQSLESNQDEVRFMDFLLLKVRALQSPACCCYCDFGWTHGLSNVHRVEPVPEVIESETSSSPEESCTPSSSSGEDTCFMLNTIQAASPLCYFSFYWECDGLRSKAGDSSHKCVDAIVKEVFGAKQVQYDGFLEKHVVLGISHFAGGILYEDFQWRAEHSVSRRLIVRLQEHGVAQDMLRMEQPVLSMTQDGEIDYNEFWRLKKREFIWQSKGKVFVSHGRPLHFVGLGRYSHGYRVVESWIMFLYEYFLKLLPWKSD